MTVTGKLTRGANGGWTVRDSASGRLFQLSGEDLPARAESCTVRLVGVIEDSFGLGVLHDEPVLRVQQWRVS